MRSLTLSGLTLLAFALLAGVAHAESRGFASQFDGATGLATGTDGSVYVSHRLGVTRFAADGRTLGVYAAGNGAHDVAVDAAGAVYLTEPTDSFLRVRKVHWGGTTEWYSPQFSGNGPLALGNGHVYYSDRGWIRSINTDTGGQWFWSVKVAAGSQPHAVADVAASGGRVFALADDRLHVFDAALNPVRVLPLGRPGAARLDAGRDGRIRVVWPDQFVEVYDGELSSLGRNDPPAPRGVAEFGDEIYTLMGTSHVLRMKKAFELVPCGGALAGVVCVPPAPPVDDPAPPVLPTVSINAGAMFTNDPNVRLKVLAPAGTTSLEVSNDGGFASPSAFTTLDAVPWRLTGSGAERLPRTVYVRFLPSGQTLKDDIILDQTDPALTRASATRTGKRYTLRIKAKDATSGLSALQLVTKRGRESRAFAATTRVALPKGKVSVRVQDHAGNWSRTRRVK